MAERWQQWMPFHIDQFRGSPDVQAMNPAARCGYIYLLAATWQTEDCSLPDDDLDLAALSGLGDELWPVHAPRIRRKFEIVSGRLTNAVLRREWLRAKAVFEKRSSGAEATNSKRKQATDHSAPAQRTQSARQANTGTLTPTSTEELKDNGLDPKCELVYNAYPRKVAKAKALRAIEKAVDHLATGRDLPRMDESQALEYLRGRVLAFARSPAGQAGDFTPHPATWFNTQRYLDDEREWHKGGSNNGGRNRSQARTDSNIAAFQSVFGNGETADHSRGGPAGFCDAGNDAYVLEGARII